MGYPVKQSQTAQPLVFLMVDSADHVTGKTGLSPTVTLSKNGGSFASPSGSVTEIGSGWYKVAGNATDTGTLGPLVLHATGSGADPTDDRFDVVSYDPQDSVRLGLTALPAFAPNANGGLPILSTSGTTLAYTISTLTTYTGDTPQTGDAYARLGAPAGASVSADIAAMKVDTAAILDDTGTSGVVVASGSKTGYTLSSAGLDSIVIETGCHARQAISIIAAATTGVASGLATTTAVYKGAGVATTRISATVDADGNRSAVTLTLPS